MVLCTWSAHSTNCFNKLKNKNKWGAVYSKTSSLQDYGAVFRFTFNKEFSDARLTYSDLT